MASQKRHAAGPEQKAFYVYNMQVCTDSSFGVEPAPFVWLLFGTLRGGTCS